MRSIIEVLLFHKHSCMMIRVMAYDFCDHIVGYIGARGNAEMNCELVGIVVLLKDRRKALIEVRFESFAGPDYCDMWCFR